MENEILHISVLKKEIIEHLKPSPNDNFIDATFNGGGHSLEILEKTKPNGKILGIELDRELLEETKRKIKNPEIEKRLILVNENFKNLKEIVKKACPEWKGRVSGIIFDLGFSSWHIEKSKKGFSFQKEEILDMRYSDKGIRAIDILNKWQEKDIEEILREYGQERYSRKIAKKIIETRKKKPILKTSELVEIIKKSVLYNKNKIKINPATRTFQALRIAVNEELENLKEVLPQAIEVLEKDGKIAIISFHSLEDRIVKNFFKEKNKEGKIKIITKKPIEAKKEEIINNPRSRSAKLRIAQKI